MLHIFLSHELGNYSSQFKKQSQSNNDHLVILQCDSGHLNGDLIACARHRIYDLRARVEEGQITHVLFIIHIPRQISCSLIGYQGAPWISAHIDDLNNVENDMVELREVIGGAGMSELFIGGKLDHGTTLPYSSQTSQSTVEDKDQAQEVDIDNVSKDPPSMEVESSSSNRYWAQPTNSFQRDEKNKPEPMELSLEDLEDFTIDDNKELLENKILQTGQISLQFSQSHIEEAISLREQIGNHIEKVDSITWEDEVESCNNSPFLQIKYKNPLFKRLYRCIQPAASKLQDLSAKRSMKRIELLVRLVPKSIFYDPGKFS